VTRSERQPDPEALLQAAIQTIEEVLAPELQSAWARGCALGLVGQLRYALSRLERDSLAEQTAQLKGCLSALFEEYPALRAVARGDDARGDESWDVREQAGRLLVFALEAEAPEALAVRERLRPLIVSQAAGDLAETAPMLQAFLASGSLGSTG